MKIDEKLKGKTIVEAEVTGYDITLKFNDGSVLSIMLQMGDTLFGSIEKVRIRNENK